MTYKEAVEMFIEHSRPCNDYYEMQFAWSCFVDCLCKDKTITLHQYNNWSTPHERFDTALSYIKEYSGDNKFFEEKEVEKAIKENTLDILNGQIAFDFMEVAV